MRDVDDKIIYALNALPTESFKGQVNSENTCRDLYSKLQQSHLSRVIPYQISHLRIARN